jgi:uncharacterized protein YcaQ
MYSSWEGRRSELDRSAATERQAAMHTALPDTSFTPETTTVFLSQRQQQKKLGEWKSEGMVSWWMVSP